MDSAAGLPGISARTYWECPECGKKILPDRDRCPYCGGALEYLNTPNVETQSLTTKSNQQNIPNISINNVHANDSLSSFKGICPSCGKKGKIGERFCKECGTELTEQRQ